jgi:hypothetical protein
VFVEDLDQMEAKLTRMRADGSVDENSTAELESLVANVKRFNEEVEGLSVW